MRSDKMTKGREKAPHRSLLHALGLTRAEMDRPFIGVVNAANEVAVGELLQSSGKEPMRIGRIFDTVEETLSRVGNLPAASLEQVMEADRFARDTARQVLHKLG